jgi:hypothetical protein
MAWQWEKTVDVQEIKERFKGLNIVVDWSRVDKINDYRNNIEHYYSPLSQDTVRALIADSFIVIRDFIRNHMGEDPLELLGAATWYALTNVAEVYDKEKEECEQNIQAVDWKYPCLQDALMELYCTECGSELIDVILHGTDRWDVDFKCRSRGKEWDFESGAALAMTKHYADENLSNEREGGEPVTIDCPNCYHGNIHS